MTHLSNNLSKIDIVVLAAGISKRFGKKNKLLADFKNKTIIGNVIDNILLVYPYKINVVVGFNKKDIIQELENKNVNFIYNSDYLKGQSTSIVKGIENIDKSRKAVMLCLGDMPFITPNEYLKIMLTHIKLGGSEKITLPYNYTRGNPVILGEKYFTKIKKLNGDIGAKNIINSFEKNIIKVKLTSNNCFIDLNTEKDLESPLITEF